MNFIRAIFRSSKEVKKLIGTDHLGNKYYEVPEDAKVLGEKLKTRRFVESNISHYEYEPGMIPYEWEAWMRGNRKLPPSAEEIAGREQQTKSVQQKAKELEENEKQAEFTNIQTAEEVTTESHTKPEGHASAPVYKKIDGESDAVSTGNEFQPAAWKPGKK
ncbi:NADH dehydrogenase [ubiquinone] 1 alpha subcomplex assembly factor 2-like [Antedon mediterranea]|uniref:NADH dehydrogenase [ubiquinone] 1 alpha subcomplex assembly factor 2-like n=1 Tax=Antedon mediterranea TaxID=105859 RepID=UPI003AF628E7